MRHHSHGLSNTTAEHSSHRLIYGYISLFTDSQCQTKVKVNTKRHNGTISLEKRRLTLSLELNKLSSTSTSESSSLDGASLLKERKYHYTPLLVLLQQIIQLSSVSLIVLHSNRNVWTIKRKEKSFNSPQCFFGRHLGFETRGDTGSPDLLILDSLFAQIFLPLFLGYI